MKHLSFHSLILCVSFFSFLNFQSSICEAQQIKTGDKFWDGAIFYTATHFSNDAVELNGKDINGDDYEINLIWLEKENCYSVFSRNGAMALRVEEMSTVRVFHKDRIAHFLVFYNKNGDAAWTLDYFLDADLQRCTLMERNIEQMPTSDVITTYLLNTTYLARFPKDELRLMRNEILARHGWQFQSKDLQNHFKKQNWYKPVKDNSTIVLSDLERTNLELIKSEEATPDDYRYSMLSPDMFPGGLADDGRGPDEVDGIQTFTVTNEREFLNALGPNRTIVIAKNVHLNLSRVLENENLFLNNTGRRWVQSGQDFIGLVPLVISEGETDGQQLDLVNIDNLTIRGAGNSSIEVAPRYSYCLYFINCKNCRVENLTIGHTEYGTCSGGVIGVRKCAGIEVRNCDLYGCGTYGFDVIESQRLNVSNCNVHHCTYGIMQLNASQGLYFTNCDFFQNKEYDLIEGRNCSNVIFSDCRFYNNNYDNTLFRFDSKFVLQGCEIYCPTDKLGTMKLADQSGKKNFFSTEADPYNLPARSIGPDQEIENGKLKNENSQLSTLNSQFPMFLYALNRDYMQMVYWSDIKEPVLNEESADYFEAEHARWELQESFRRNAAQYRNFITNSGKVHSLKYIGEVLKDSKGNDMYLGELHSRPSIPSPGLKYAFTNLRLAPKDDDLWGMWVVVTDDYLRDHAFVPMKYHNDAPKALPAKIVKQLEKQYNMKAERSQLIESSKRFSYGVLQFKGEWKSRVSEYGDTTHLALALEVFTVDGKVYAYPMEGYYDKTEGPTWNADDGGEYFGGDVTVFDGPDGPDFCHIHGAPESITVSLFTIRDGQLNMRRYEVYHSLYDESDPE